MKTYRAKFGNDHFLGKVFKIQCSILLFKCHLFWYTVSIELDEKQAQKVIEEWNSGEPVNVEL